MSSERVLAECCLATLEAAFRAAQDMVLVLDPGNAIRAANPAAQSLLGASDRELRGQSVTTVLARHLVLRPGEQTPDVGAEGVREICLRSAGAAGRYLTVSLSTSPLLDPSGAPVGALLVGRDLTELRQAREQADRLDRVPRSNGRPSPRAQDAERVTAAQPERRQLGVDAMQMEQLTAMGELAAAVAHELNQPLNAAKMIVQSMMRYAASTPADLQELLGLVNAMARTVDQIRLFSRKGAAGPGASLRGLDLNDAVHNALGLIGQQLKLRGIELVKNLRPDLPTVLGDMQRVQQVILNLLANARDALARNGAREKRIEIATDTSAREGGRFIVLEIRDTGSGIPEAARDKVFLPFFTTKRVGEGTGLGLSIVKRIVDDHGGRIELESRVDQGTTFRVFLRANEFNV